MGYFHENSIPPARRYSVQARARSRTLARSSNSCNASYICAYESFGSLHPAHQVLLTMAAISRRVSYILPSPSDPPPLLSLPTLGERRHGHTSPNLVLKEAHAQSNGSPFLSRNPFALSPPPQPRQPSHPRHCLGISSLALDTSTLLANTSSPGGILYTGGRDGLVASWELGVPHKRRRGAKYDCLPERGGRAKWERIGDGAEMWADDEEEDEEDGDEDEGYSSSEELGREAWAGVNGERVADGMRRRKAGRGEVPYEDKWEIDRDELTRRKVSLPSLY